jgi:hypothetical protein
MRNTRPHIITGPGGVYRRVHRLQASNRGPDVVTPPKADDAPTEGGAQLLLSPVLVAGLICSHLVAYAVGAWLSGSGAAAAGVLLGMLAGAWIVSERKGGAA